MRLCVALAVVMAALAASWDGARAQTRQQTTQGWCSPAVADTRGNVSIVCQGVSPKALDRLNELLDKKDLELKARIAEADQWAARYRDLEARLATVGPDDAKSEEARRLIEAGDFETAGVLLDEIIAAQEAALERRLVRLAADHVNRADLYELQSDPAAALPHYEAAVRYAPDDVRYGLALAATLQQQNRYAEAEARYDDIRKRPDLEAATRGRLLNSLGVLYQETSRTGEAEAAYKQAVTTFRALAAAQPDVYETRLATTLSNLGTLLIDDRRLVAAEAALREALAISRRRAAVDPALAADVAEVLSNLGQVYWVTRRFDDAAAVVGEALGLQRALAAGNPMAYAPELANSLNNMAILHRAQHRLDAAVAAHTEALAIRRRLAKANPEAYEPDVATSLNNLTVVYMDLGETDAAERSIREAIAIRQWLAARNPGAFGTPLGRSVMILTRMLENAGTMTEADCALVEEALAARPGTAISRDLSHRHAAQCVATGAGAE